MPLKAGHCTGCGTCIWRTAVAQRDTLDGTKAGEVFLLWPKPDSLYARVQTSTGYTPGIAYCPSCAPPLGTPGPLPGNEPIVVYETAKGRYQDWYTDRQGEFYRVWLKDQLQLEEADVQRLIAQWEADRA